MKKKTICTRCKEEKRIEEFTINQQRKHGHASHCKECENKRAIELRNNLRHEIYKNYGGEFCNNCNESLFEVLTLDHINGVSEEEKKIVGSRRPYPLFRWLKRLNYPSGYQVLCNNCNFLKFVRPHLLDEYARYFWKRITGTHCTGAMQVGGTEGAYIRNQIGMSKERSPVQYRKEKLIQLKEEIYNQYGGAVCCNCGEDFFETLSLDHINGGGYQQCKKLKRTGKSFFYYLRNENYPPGYQVLCRNCNYLKHFHPELYKQRKKINSSYSCSSVVLEQMPYKH